MFEATLSDSIDTARASEVCSSILEEAHFCHTLVRRVCTFNMAGLTSGARPDAAWMANSLLPGFEGSGPISGRPTVGDSLIPQLRGDDAASAGGQWAATAGRARRVGSAAWARAMESGAEGLRGGGCW